MFGDRPCDIRRGLQAPDAVARREHADSLLAKQFEIAEKRHCSAAVSDGLVARDLRPEKHQAESSRRRFIGRRHHLVEPLLGEDADAVEFPAVQQRAHEPAHIGPRRRERARRRGGDRFENGRGGWFDRR